MPAQHLNGKKQWTILISRRVAAAFWLLTTMHCSANPLSTNLIEVQASRRAPLPDGSSAVRHLASGPDTDIVLLDWKMPGMSGIEVLQRLRSEKIDIPIIFLTVLSDQIYEEVGLLGGAVDFRGEIAEAHDRLLRRIELILTGYKTKAAQQPAGAEQNTAKFDDLILRYNSRRATWKQINIGLTLTGIQYHRLSCRACRPRRQLSRDLRHRSRREGFMAGDGDVGYRTNVRSFIKRICQKFRDIDPDFSQIKNYPSFGYRWQNGKRPVSARSCFRA